MIRGGGAYTVRHLVTGVLLYKVVFELAYHFCVVITGSIARSATRRYSSYS